MVDCLFCKIINKEIPSQIVYEDDNLIVIKDIQPVAPTHLLAIPKQHVENVADPKFTEAGLANLFFDGIQKVAKELGLVENGFRIVANCGSEAGQTVFHLHFHIISGRPLSWPPG
ncbi:MAG TPA: histidine triad nucleotide-binding protein [Bacillota bacterium]|nr:histidine triad nucleotide-binding protein [Bacillota bacterium]HOL09408.1 histidine triad nucleotide-binding protein [Bacillota bacterium]HPO97132.1 histidine triad nucleotide-binding protein [Bacillota bacterium]